MTCLIIVLDIFKVASWKTIEQHPFHNSPSMFHTHTFLKQFRMRSSEIQPTRNEQRAKTCQDLQEHANVFWTIAKSDFPWYLKTPQLFQLSFSVNQYIYIYIYIYGKNRQTNSGKCRQIMWGSHGTLVSVYKKESLVTKRIWSFNLPPEVRRVTIYQSECVLS